MSKFAKVTIRLNSTVMEMMFFIIGIVTCTSFCHPVEPSITAADLPAGSRWVFDHPFFLVLNIAVGGKWPGSPDASTTFPQALLVDHVRVYQ